MHILTSFHFAPDTDCFDPVICKQIQAVQGLERTWKLQVLKAEVGTPPRSVSVKPVTSLWCAPGHSQVPNAPQWVPFGVLTGYRGLLNPVRGLSYCFEGKWQRCCPPLSYCLFCVSPHVCLSGISWPSLRVFVRPKHCKIFCNHDLFGVSQSIIIVFGVWRVLLL